jgi:Ca-activated chloride channel homolog
MNLDLQPSIVDLALRAKIDQPGTFNPQEAAMKTKIALVIFILVGLSLIPTPARADGIIIPDPPICIDECPPPPCRGPLPCPPRPPIVQLAIRFHHVTVTIHDQLAVTHVDQVFFNPNDWQIEGTYIFPIPVDAAVSSFTLWVDGKPVEGKILDAEQARQKYEEIVRSMKDPALLEYVDRGAVQARIFPIPPGGERRIELEYVQALAADNGLVRYTYPLSTEKFSLWPLEDVSISVEVRSTGAPIRAAYSPSHDVAISRQDERNVSVGYEAKDVLPDSDFTLYYSLGEEQAFHLLSYRDQSDLLDPDGFFLALLAPRPEAARESLSKDVILVLDRSGSMEGEKFHQAQEALRYILGHLNPEDRFNVIVFSTGLETYASGLRQADEANEAIAWVDRQSAQGSTDINRALLEAAAMADSERPTYLIFLTDGLPTEGEADSQKILDNFARAASGNLRLFAFGVGYDVDTVLLDSLAQAHHGTTTYVLPEERLDEVISAFYAKVSTPVLTDLELDFGDLRAYDIYPQPLPDLFAGSQIIVVGRYREGGAASVTLRGTVDGRTQTFSFDDQRFAVDDSEAQSSALSSQIPRLWATRKIGHLLNQIRLHGPDKETIDQIVRLSIRYGIVTPYTSYLVTEEMPLGAAEQERIAAEQYNQLSSQPAAPSSGQAAVEKAAGQGGMADAESAAAPPAEAVQTVRIVGSKVFVSTEGVWIDTAFDPEKMETVKVAFLSDDYFALAASRPALAAAFALGNRVIALSDGVAYEVVPSGTPVEPLKLPPTLAAAPESTELPVPTEKPGLATPEPDLVTPIPPAAPGTMPCASGLLPLGFVPLAVLWLRRRK